MFIIEFTNNNNVLTFIKMLFFYANKGFHSRINFDHNIINYVIIRKRLNVAKAQDIIDRI